ncbi:AraC family transcriptional regulator [Galbibacter sp. EGI 63066]|uniref:helix-turn-helix domain-containing protein n=1 Tax=Galbibacter sp. EGI 63066 TaxID=2993559 RepID=UPI002248DD5E|nr:helix-turn-helix domain-containing protein [Galbibacter sp. EGI 63066]MCX2679789.1 AraC family transcriptional regulator [Galbibacter sp. EGI 63066]
MDNESLKIKEGFVGQRMIVLPPDVRKKIEVNPIINSLYITAIGYYPFANYHDRERKKGCDEYILLYCVKGKGVIFIGNEELELQPNEFFIIPVGIPHHYKSSLSNPWSIYWIHFIGNNADSIYERLLKYNSEKTIKIPYDEQRTELFLKMIKLLENSFDDASLELSNIYLLHYISSFIYQSRTNDPTERKNPVNESINFMKKHIDKSLSVNDLASEQFLSVSRYSELFKTATGTSPIKYFIHLKIQKSCQYLYFTNMNVKEIANALGFTDPFYFSRMFKQVLGLSPSKYKKDYKR